MSFVIQYEPNELNHPAFRAATGADDIGNENAEKSLDSFHDDLAFEFSKSKPGTLEHIVFENTKIIILTTDWEKIKSYKICYQVMELV